MKEKMFEEFTSKRERVYEFIIIVMIIILLVFIALMEEHVNAVVDTYKWHILAIILIFGVYLIRNKTLDTHNDVFDMAQAIKERRYQINGERLDATPDNVRATKLTDYTYIIEFKSNGVTFTWDNRLKKIVGIDRIPMRSKLREMEAGLLREYISSSSKRDNFEKNLEDIGFRFDDF